MARGNSKVLVDSVTVLDILTFLLLDLQELPFCDICSLHPSIRKVYLIEVKVVRGYGDAPQSIDRLNDRLLPSLIRKCPPILRHSQDRTGYRHP
jgi:hypothetical protein